MSRELNVKVFEDTVKQYKTNERLKESVYNTRKETKVYLESQSLCCVERDLCDTKIIVSKDRSFEAARKLSQEGYKNICVHNFAFATNPGGGVTKGSSAQEESLCRVSTLYDSLVQPMCMEKFYYPHREQSAIHNADCIYTPNVIVFKTDTGNPILMKEEDWYNVNVITCAAPNLRQNTQNRFNCNEVKTSVKITDKELLSIHKTRLQRILDIAYANSNDCVVLGAFGCGAFQNNPNIVARATKEILKENEGKFKKVIIAVYCNPSDETNYNVFKRSLGN